MNGTAFERGWSHLNNGELLDVAEREGFGVLVTTDTNLKFQQNLSGRRITIVVLLSTSWPRIERASAQVAKIIDTATPGATPKSKSHESDGPAPVGLTRSEGSTRCWRTQIRGYLTKHFQRGVGLDRVPRQLERSPRR
jgi:hypothetical protein